ncbi:MAG: MBOAT family protein [Candidatus Omnitrophica bacterium]|nr:MBOAT family protein [Candidatus Omnitrophota bacterium]
MPFNSLKYFLFLPIVYLAFYFIGQRVRWVVLLAASLLFYAALNVPYLLIVLMLVAITTYTFGILLDRAKTTKARRTMLWSGIAANIFILIIMKYLPALSKGIIGLSKLFSFNTQTQPIRALVAIGVSYYIFQAISYLADVYLEIIKPERHIGYFALYLAFFPKLLQGPIERAGGLIPQLKARYEFNYNNMRLGILMCAWGLFKKIVIADRLGLYVNAVYNNVHVFSGLSLLLATYAYAFQIYMDFSGYTDMALGSALLFNINLTQNFNSPYTATSVADFWRRWHISFSRWIFDYIFKPLQMQWRDRRNWGTAAALIVTFFVSGIWHGASCGFVIWGLLHGLYLACSVFYRPYQKKLHKTLRIEKTWFLRAWQIFVTFNLVCFAWVFFRAENLADAFYIITNIFNYIKGARLEFLLSQGEDELVILAIVVFIYWIISATIKRCDFASFIKLSIYMKCLIVYAFIATILILAKFKHTDFIYFNF